MAMVIDRAAPTSIDWASATLTHCEAPTVIDLGGADRDAVDGAAALGVVGGDGHGLVGADGGGVVGADRRGPVGADGGGVVGADRSCPAGVDDLIHVLGAWRKTLLCAGLILEAELVEAAAARGRRGLDRGLGLVVGEEVRRRVVAVVDAADDQRAVGIAVDEVDDDLHPDPRDEEAAPARSGEALGDADPPRGALVDRGEAIPVGQELDPPVLVAVHVLAWRAGDRRRLDPGDLGLVLGQDRPERQAERLALEGVGVAGGHAARGRLGDRLLRALAAVDRRGDQVLAAARVAADREGAAGADHRRVAGSARALARGGEALVLDRRQALGVVGVDPIVVLVDLAPAAAEILAAAL
ncbi:MAG: hypothetical protein R3A79_03365 [Nannocystaceae bacterium]